MNQNPTPTPPPYVRGPDRRWVDPSRHIAEARARLVEVAERKKAEERERIEAQKAGSQ